MFGLVRKKNPYEQPARGLYATALEATRQKKFYTSYGVPDTLDGRFDLLVLHAFIILHVLKERDDSDQIGQGLFDVIFADMDQGLRENGIGDMGVPKHMRRMMKGFNGRVQAYEMALKSRGKKELHDALVRNVYGTLETPKPEHTKTMVEYVRKNIQHIKKQSLNSLQSGTVKFLKP